MNDRTGRWKQGGARVTVMKDNFGCLIGAATQLPELSNPENEMTWLSYN